MAKKVLLCCAAGMSTSLLITKMRQDIEDRSLDLEITAMPISEGIEKVGEFDVVLLGPQVGYSKANFEKEADGRINVAVIPMADYGRMNAAKIDDLAVSLLK